LLLFYQHIGGKVVGGEWSEGIELEAITVPKGRNWSSFFC